MRKQHASNNPVTVAGQPLAEVNSFIYLGSTVDTQGAGGGGGGRGEDGGGGGGGLRVRRVRGEGGAQMKA